MTMTADKTDTCATRTEGGGIFHTLGLVILVMGTVFGFGLLPRVLHHENSELAGKIGPDFQLPVVANAPAADVQTLALNQYKGKAVILDFWATWCGPCQAQSPVLDRMAHRYQDRGLAVVGINTSDAPGAAEKWIKAHGITYPIAYDEGDAARLYGVSNLPTLVILSREGKVVAVREGFTGASELESLLQRVL